MYFKVLSQKCLNFIYYKKYMRKAKKYIKQFNIG